MNISNVSFHVSYAGLIAFAIGAVPLVVANAMTVPVTTLMTAGLVALFVGTALWYVEEVVA